METNVPEHQFLHWTTYPSDGSSHPKDLLGEISSKGKWEKIFDEKTTCLSPEKNGGWRNSEQKVSNGVIYPICAIGTFPALLQSNGIAYPWMHRVSVDLVMIAGDVRKAFSPLKVLITYACFSVLVFLQCLMHST